MNKNFPDCIILTIFTPTYNRADLLPYLFESISRQVCPGDSVEWLIIDDGSTDNTPKVIAEFIKQRPDLVRAIRVANGGKHRAINRVAKEAIGDWILIVDSDDRMINGAVFEILSQISEIKERLDIGVIRGLKSFPELRRNNEFNICANPSRYVDWLVSQSTFDTAEVIRRSYLLRFPFPDNAGEKFMAEGWLWHTLDKNFLTNYLNNYWIECRYQDSGLSANSRINRANSPINAMDVYGAMLCSPLPWKLHIRASINWWRYCFHARRRKKIFFVNYSSSVLFAIPGLLIFLLDMLQMRCLSKKVII